MESLGFVSKHGVDFKAKLEKFYFSKAGDVLKALR